MSVDIKEGGAWGGLGKRKMRKRKDGKNQDLDYAP